MLLMPPPREGVGEAVALALAAMLCVQAGAAVSTMLFDQLGPTGTAWLRLCWSAAFLLAWSRPRLSGIGWRELATAIALGGATAAMTICFFQAIDRLPLGTASALEFLGPLAVAMAGLRRPLDVIWPLAAGAGVIALTDPWASTVDLVGVAFALVAAACWGTYIVLTQRVGDRFSGLDGLAVSMTAAAVIAAGPGLPAVLGRVNVQVLAITAAIALLLPALPYAFEMVALRRLTTSSFGTLMSLEPAIGTVVGLVLLAQTPGPGQLAGIALVTIAGIGAARRGHRAT